MLAVACVSISVAISHIEVMDFGQDYYDDWLTGVEQKYVCFCITVSASLYFSVKFAKYKFYHKV